MRLDFLTVDVFTDRRFGGNPLAVIPDARGLTTEQMQATAGEFNLAETTFVLPPKDARHTAEVRIFTPRFEMPFAGHPNIGTAFALAALGKSRGFINAGAIGERLIFEEKAGLVHLDIIKEASSVVGATLRAPQLLSRGEDVPIEAVAAACGMDVAEIATANHLPCLASCGTSFAFAEVKSRAALKAARPRADGFSGLLAPDRATGILLYLRLRDGSLDIEARMFAPLYGVPEDPATGSAHVALAGLLASLAAEPDLSLRLMISQGVDMGRPSLLEASAEKRGGQIAETRIGGRCVPVMQGTLEI
jgi:trans-2,3-dihydro-3-hydroxyanthranilate isomerase